MSKEHKLRKAIRAGKVKPTPEGVLVIGRLPGVKVPVRSWCRGHLFETHKAIKNKNWQSGWQQGATCIVCRDNIAPIDSSWWIRRATRKDIKRCMRLLREQATHYKNVYKVLRRRMASYEED